MSDFNFKYRGREGVKCTRVQIDTLSYEPLHKRIERFLSGDASSLDGADTTKAEYDEPEKVGDDDSVFEPTDVRDDSLNQQLDNLDIAELRCDSQKAIAEKSAILKQKKAKQPDKQAQQPDKQAQQPDKQAQQPDQQAQQPEKKE